jgi:hypothetical protein
MGVTDMPRYLSYRLAHIPHCSAFRRIHQVYPSQEDVDKEPEQQRAGRCHVSGCVIERHIGECYRILD